MTEAAGTVPEMTPEEVSRDRYLRRTHGITLADYNAIVAYQGGLCAICRRPPGKRPLHLDHDHKTGRPRGALCWLCNHDLIGRRRDPAIFRAAARYLEDPPADAALLGT